MYPRAQRRIIVITVCISEKISGHQEAYENLIQALINIQMSTSDLLYSSDYICYNIGAPLANNYLRSDLQRLVPKFEETFLKYEEHNNKLRNSDEVF